jgi:hypothetical protein
LGYTRGRLTRHFSGLTPQLKSDFLGHACSDDTRIFSVESLRICFALEIDYGLAVFIGHGQDIIFDDVVPHITLIFSTFGISVIRRKRLAVRPAINGSQR